MRPISTVALDAINAGARYSTLVTIQRPGEDPVEVERSPGWSVTENGPVSGTRLSLSALQLLRTPGIDDLFGYAGFPGAVFQASIGIYLGPSIEWIPVFTGYAMEGSSSRNSTGVSVSLSDPWGWADRVPFTTPLETTLSTRANLIGEIFYPVLPNLSLVVEDDGGEVSQAGVYTGSRGQAAGQLAADGLLQAGFNARGELVVKAQPDLTDADPQADWEIRSGQDLGEVDPTGQGYPTIIAGTLERVRPWSDSLINAVAIIPGQDWQPWSAQVVKLVDESDPRHESKIGLRGIEIVSNTASTTCEALALGQKELTRHLRSTDERLRVLTLLNPAAEADDTLRVAALPTYDDLGYASKYIISSVTHSPKEGTTSFDAVSAAGYNLGV